jgi:hypothetical protein
MKFVHLPMDILATKIQADGRRRSIISVRFDKRKFSGNRRTLPDGSSVFFLHRGHVIWRLYIANLDRELSASKCCCRQSKQNV